MKLELITLLGEKMNEDVYEVQIPTVSGEIAVFPGHEALVSVAVPGIISVRRTKGAADSTMELFASDGGVIDITPKRVRILVDEAVADEDIVEDESRAALERAQKMRDEATDQVELERATQLVDRHAVRLKLAGIRRRR